jgi:acetolactate synthase-1/2/3 large subunit
LSSTIDRAFQIANEGKKGVVHIDIPKCVSYQEFNYEDTSLYLLDKKLEDNIYPTTFNDKSKGFKYNIEQYKTVGELINNAKKPILYIGQGCKDASYELSRLAIFGNIPVTSTIHGTGIFDEHRELSLRWCGMHGYAPANIALQDADLIIAIGSRFDDRTTGALEKYAPKAKEASVNGTGGIIHCNIEPSELDFVVESDYNFCLESKEFIKNILPFIKTNPRADWIKQLNSLKEKHPFKIKKHGVELHMEHVLDTLYRKTIEEKVLFTTGVGNHQMQTYQFIKSQYPGKIISSGSLGVMGAGLPYAIGTQLANPNNMVICIDGDSSFNMTFNDMKTIMEYNLPIKIAIMNNNAQMMVTIWEKLFFEERYTATINEKNPDYVSLAKSFGIEARKCDTARTLEKDIDYFINYNKGPILMEFNIKRDICLPLVKPGCALDDMILQDETEVSDIKNKGLVPS